MPTYNPPTFVNSYNTSYSSATTPLSTLVTTQAGDTVIVCAALANGTDTASTISGNGITFTSRASYRSNEHESAVYLWSGTDTSGGTNWTLQLQKSGFNSAWGFTCLVFRDAGGIVAGTSTATAGNPSLSITTLQDNSAIVVVDCDWNATADSSRVWRTVNGIAPTSGNGMETTYQFISGQMTVYGAYYSSAGTAGAKTVGLSGSVSQQYAIAACEIKGVAADDPASAIPLMWVQGVNG